MGVQEFLDIRMMPPIIMKISPGQGMKLLDIQNGGRRMEVKRFLEILIW
jgi:hypothetical protein